MNSLSELMSELDVDQQTQNKSENSVFSEHEKFQIFFFSSIQSDSSTLNLNVNLRRRSEKTKMQKMKQSNKSRKHSRESLNVYLNDTLSKNANQKNTVNFIRRKQNQFAESYNELLDYFMNKFEKFDDRLNQLDSKLDALPVTIDSKFETLKDKMTRNIATVLKIEFADFRKNFKEKLKIEFVSKSSVSQKTVILNIAKNVSTNKPVLHSKSKISHDNSESSVQNPFIKQNVRSENYKFIFDQTSHMKQKSEMIFSFESSFNQNSNIFSYFQLTFEAPNKQFRLFDNDLSNNDHEDRRSRSMNRSEYIKNQSQSRDRHDVSIPEMIMTTKPNQFKTSDFDFFYSEYPKNQNSIDYVIEKKKTIYIDVHMFVETVRRFTANKNILEHLHFCLKNATQIWYIALSPVKRDDIMLSIEIFCFTLITRYENHSANSYAKFQTQQYIIRDVQKRRQPDEYVSILMRHDVSLNAFELTVLTKTWNSLNKKLRKHVRKPDKRTTTENFTRNLENATGYYASDINKKNAIEIAYQREVKSKQIQNSERFDRYSEPYSENYSTNYFSRLQDAQPSRNWQTFQRNAYTSTPLQNRSQYSQQNQISATQNSSFSQRTSQYSTRSTQYFSSSSSQKLLINNANYNVSYNAFISSSYESEDHMQYDYNVNSEYEKEQTQTQTINENTKFETLEHANFDDIIISFHAETSKLEIFNDEKRIRHDMISMSCNICKKSYINNDDRTRLNNHMREMHDIDTTSRQSMNQKRYINWMKHATLHVITIRESSPKREYVTIQARLYDEINENISICIDTEFNVNFIDKFLLPEDNLWNRLHNCHPITVRSIANERIVDQQMNIFMYVIATDGTTKRIETKIYVSKSIKIDVILNMNELDKTENDIIL